MKRVFALVLFPLLLLSCGRDEQPAPRSAAAATATAPAVSDDTPQDGGTLIRRVDGDVVTLNPVMAQSKYDRWVAQYLFTPMIYLDENLQPIPGLAESWEISPDGKEYTFHLNEKATFSDGKPVTARDAIFTITKIADPETEAAQLHGNFDKVDLTRTRAIDEHTVVFAFREPLAPQFLQFLTLYVVPEHVYAQGDFKNDYNSKAVGSGPYVLVRREPGKEVVVQRRKDYWGVRPHIETVVFKLIVDAKTAWNALKLGEIDETSISADVWAMESKRPELQKTIDFRRFYTLSYNFIAWNGRDPILRDKRVRRAISMCVDVGAIINNLYHGTARAMSGPFTPDEWGYNPSVPVLKFDPVEAKHILNSIGWLDTNGDGILDKEGKPLKFEMFVFAGSAAAGPFAQMLQAELKNIGVQLDISVLDPAALIARVLRGNYQAAYLSWDTDADPDLYGIFHSSQMPPRGQNVVFYNNPEVDQLIEQGRHTIEQSKRIPIYQRLHEVLAADQPYTWTLQVSIKWALRKRVKGVKESRGTGLYNWYPGELGWWIDSRQR